MIRRAFLVLGLLLVVPAFAQATTVSVVGGPVIELLPNTPDQVISFRIDATEAYSSTDVKTQINGGVGPAPFVTHVFNDPAAGIPVGNLAGSVWQNGFGGILLDPEGTAPGSSGLTTSVGFSTPGFGATNASGLYMTFTISTVGVPAGNYLLTFDDSIITYVDEDFNGTDIAVNWVPATLSIPVPEPSSVVLGLFGAAGLAAVAVRRRRNG